MLEGLFCELEAHAVVATTETTAITAGCLKYRVLESQN